MLIGGIGAIFFFFQLLRIIPTVIRLFIALRKHTIVWPGPLVYDPNLRVARSYQWLGVKNYLFPFFLKYTIGVLCGCIFFAMVALNVLFLWFVPKEGKEWVSNILLFIGGLSGFLSLTRALYAQKWIKSVIETKLSYPYHYLQTAYDAPGEKCELTLIHSDVTGPHINLVYQWESELSHDEADNLDTRARAYIACSIYDAAIAAGLSCQPDLPHGRRPSWCIEGERMISLVHAGFDVSNKTCFMTIGGAVISTKEALMAKKYCKELIKGFQSLFHKLGGV